MATQEEGRREPLNYTWRVINNGEESEVSMKLRSGSFDNAVEQIGFRVVNC